MESATLTAKQIREIDNISADKDAMKRTLEVAINYHSNRLNAIIKDERAWWDDIAEIYNLDPSKKYKVGKSSGDVCILEMKDADNA
jgi:hypothetical protein